LIRVKAGTYKEVKYVRRKTDMFVDRRVGRAAGAFCQTYVQFSVDDGASPYSLNEKGKIAGTGSAA
jgi:hypothetical protein